jgi:hypothetical protein
MSAEISLSDFVLLLRGWLESKRNFRVVLESPTVTFGVFCRLFAVADDGSFSIAIGDETNVVGIVWTGFKYGFTDGSGEPILGRKVESGLVAVRRRPNVRLFLMLLAE